MGFGAIIASGENNLLLRDDLLDCITEVRVEQSLDDPTYFAIRFQEDISSGQPRIRGAADFQCGQIITIAVKVADEIKCLVRGPITEREWSVMLGGPGSWFEIRGQDRRIEMDRECKRRIWTGLESDAALTVLKDEYKFRKTCIQVTQKVYGGGPGNEEPTIETLNQRATDEDFMKQIACRNNMSFWIQYECRQNGLNAGGGSLKVTEIANLRSSPLRPDAKGLADCQQQVARHRNAAATLRVNVESARCSNVTAFNITEDSERASHFKGFAIDDRAGQSDPTEATDPQPAIAKGGERLETCNPRRDVCITTAGNLEELFRKAVAALTEAGWRINATASTTAHMLGAVLLPHDEVKVEGLGTKDSERYQVNAVTHVINAADHFMDLQLRRNATGG
ncbi:MAG TPA: hypothetical protein VF131_04715 [Blastocatellia bacterium]|nr:hypothetical protein [Blastocatellia bacterium]